MVVVVLGRSVPAHVDGRWCLSAGSGGGEECLRWPGSRWRVGGVVGWRAVLAVRRVRLGPWGGVPLVEW